MKFKGYIVSLLESDEYLSHFKDDEFSTFRGWSNYPNMAIRFKTLELAKKVSLCCDNSIVDKLFETKVSFIVEPINEI